MRLPTKRFLPFKIVDLFAMLIVIAFGAHLFFAFTRWERVEERWQQLCRMQEYFALPQELPKSVQTTSSSPPFLMHEIKKLEAMERNSLQQKRLEFLTSGENQWAFEESALGSWMQKKQLHPVEMDEEDLKRWLTIVEGVEIWPYKRESRGGICCIQECTLEKKILPSQEKIYEITMNILEYKTP